MKSEMIIEQFDNGITIRWNDVEGDLPSEKKVVGSGMEKSGIGEIIWDDVYNILDKESVEKVLVRIECSPIK